MLDGGLSLLGDGRGDWELRGDLDVDLVVSLGILRAPRREGGKDSRKARKNELNSATAPIAWSRALFAWSQESHKKKTRTERQAEKDAKLSSLQANESENKLKKFYSPRNKLDSTSSLRLKKVPR